MHRGGSVNLDDLTDPDHAAGYALRMTYGQVRGMPPVPPPRRILTRFAAGHGWTSPTPAAVAEDTTVRLFTDRSLRGTTDGANGSLYFDSPTFPAQDWSTSVVRVWLRLSDRTKLATAQFYAIAGTGNTFTAALRIHERNGEWMPVTIPRSAFTVVGGTPVWSGITQARVQLRDSGGGNVVTAHLGGVELLPDQAAQFPTGVFILEADDGYVGHLANLLPVVAPRGVPVTLNVISERCRGASPAAGMTEADLVNLHHAHGWQIACHAHTAAAHDGPTTAAQMADDLRQQQAWLRSLGLGAGADDLALSPGTGGPAVTPDMLAVIRGGFRSARAFGGFVETVAPADYSRIRSQGFGSGRTNTLIQTDIDACSGPGGAFVLALHDVVAGSVNSGAAMAAGNLATVLDYAAGRGMRFLTRGQWLDAESSA
jgi:hypothetical protein